MAAPSYLDEIFDSLRDRGVTVDHFFVDVPADVLRKRIEAQSIWPDDLVRDAQVRTWRLEQVERCAAAVGALPVATVLDGELPVAALAAQVMTRVAA